MNNDKAFALYAILIFSGVASVLTASVMAGVAALPTPLVFLEHLAMSFGFRAAYKSFEGWDWSEWSLTSDALAAPAAPAAPAEAAAGAGVADAVN
jgi:hypothetical protein